VERLGRLEVAQQILRLHRIAAGFAKFQDSVSLPIEAIFALCDVPFRVPKVRKNHRSGCHGTAPAFIC
jgi:hypothetical protein